MFFRRLLAFPFCVVLFAVLPAFSGDKKDDKVPFEVYAKGYFVKNKAAADYLVVADKKTFDDTFGVATVMKAKPKLVEANLFESSLIVSVIKSGNSVTTYDIEQVTRDKNKLIVKYKATPGQPSTAQFRSPLILAVPRADVAEIVLIENGKEVRKLEVKK